MGGSGAGAGDRSEFLHVNLQILHATEYCSVEKRHLCGHEGHTTILLGLARLIMRKPHAKGRVVLLFQPAEEDGSGAAAVLADPRLGEIRPDWAFALHNMPGLPLVRGRWRTPKLYLVSFAVVFVADSPCLGPRDGDFARAGAGRIDAPGAESRAGWPAWARVQAGQHLPRADGSACLGITGDGELWLTLRTLEDADMASLRDEVTELARTLAAISSLACGLQRDFAALAPDPDATFAILRA